MLLADILATAVALGELRFVSLPWLRKLKTAASRHKDLDDLENLPPLEDLGQGAGCA